MANGINTVNEGERQGVLRAWAPFGCRWGLEPDQQPHLPDIPCTHMSLDLTGVMAEEG